MTNNFWACPICTRVIHKEQQRWYCATGHSFDKAKQGYVNLLLVQDKRSKKPGDNKAMAIARRRFLSAGFYDILLNTLAQYTTTGQWLDMGCGEGYYSAQLHERGSDNHWCGVDISKESIKLAAQTHKLDFVVASNYKLPITNAACDGILQIFSPMNTTEVIRLLSPTGCLLRVLPGPNHLHELRAKIYQNVMPHNKPLIPEGLRLVSEESIKDTIRLNSANHLLDLIAMTPYQWHGSRRSKESLEDVSDFNVNLDFTVQQLVSAQQS